MGALRRVGKRGLENIRSKRKAVFDYCVRFGHKEDDDLWGNCQSCGGVKRFVELDFSHKIPAGRDSKGNTPENGTAMCRRCHVWLETGKWQVEAREALMASAANLNNGFTIQWPLGLYPDLLAALR